MSVDPQPTPLQQQPDWESISRTPAFRKLVRAKARFVVPVTIFFIVYYFALLILVGYFPELMRRKLFGSINLAYLFALSQFFVAWLIALLYARAASRFDRQAAAVIEASIACKEVR